MAEPADDLLDSIRTLLNEANIALDAKELNVTSVTTEWTLSNGRMRPHLYVVLEPKEA